MRQAADSSLPIERHRRTQNPLTRSQTDAPQADLAEEVSQSTGACPRTSLEAVCAGSAPGITASERFRAAYLYQEEELEPWAPRIKELAAQTWEVHVLMNNCCQDYAVVNARQLPLLVH